MAKARKRAKRKKPQRRWIRWVIFASVIALLGIGLGVYWKPLRGIVELSLRRNLQPNPQAYASQTQELERSRLALAARYQKATTIQQRQAVEAEARTLLETQLPLLMRCWLGTPWDFKGTAERPGAGKIACGYFVSTVLKDAGFRVDRYKLAQQPSGNILQTFLAKDDCELTIRQEFTLFRQDFAKHPAGIYLVGLDTHVGFLVVAGGQVDFIHSSGSSPWCVVDTPLADAHVVEHSRWRMLGNLTASPQVIRLWLKGEKIAVKV